MNVSISNGFKMSVSWPITPMSLPTSEDLRLFPILKNQKSDEWKNGMEINILLASYYSLTFCIFKHQRQHDDSFFEIFQNYFIAAHVFFY